LQTSNTESREEAMRTNGTLHIFAFAALSLAVAGGSGSVQARRALSQPLSATAIDQVTCSEATPPRVTRAAIFKAEVLLDRLDISPGIMDGKTGENVRKAIAAFQHSRGLAASGKLDRTTWNKLCESTNAPALIAYTITDDDVRGPFVPEIPRDLEGMARLIERWSPGNYGAPNELNDSGRSNWWAQLSEPWTGRCPQSPGRCI
jgi:peptidoglycan hydrolase-like protein with peptidoglycan-binding domain